VGGLWTLIERAEWYIAPLPQKLQETKTDKKEKRERETRQQHIPWAALISARSAYGAKLIARKVIPTMRA